MTSTAEIHMPPLPLHLTPGRGEAWISYLTRRAAQHGCTLAALGDHIGLREGGYWSGLLGVRIDAALAEHVAQLLGLSRPAIERMQLSSYDHKAFNLDGISAAARLAEIRAVAARHWVWLSGTSFCPQCLAFDREWQVRWRLPWAVTCPTHRVLLNHHCPACGTVPGVHNRLSGSAPARAMAPPDTRACQRPVGDGVCGADLSAAPALAAPAEAIARDQVFADMFTNGRGRVAGAEHSALRAVRAWQSTIGLALHLGITSVPGWGAHRGTEPPPDTATMHQLLQVAAPVIEAPSTQDAADVVAGWCHRAGIRSPNAHTFARGMQPAAALTPVTDHILATTGRAHTRLRRMSDLDGQHRIPVVDYDLDDIPQLIWPCALPESLRSSTKPDALILRAVVSMILVRMHGARTWADAGAPLLFPASKATTWTRYAFAVKFGHRSALLTAAHNVAPTLVAQPERHSWSARTSLVGNGLTAFANAQKPSCCPWQQPQGECTCLG